MSTAKVLFTAYLQPWQHAFGCYPSPESPFRQHHALCAFYTVLWTSADVLRDDASYTYTLFSPADTHICVLLPNYLGVNITVIEIDIAP